MFLWSLLNKSEEELVKRVFLAQCEFDLEESWVSNVKDELRSCRIYLTFDEISSLSKHQFKKIVKSRVFQKAKEYLFEIQQNHSKTRNLVIGDKIKKYLLSFDISLKMKQTIFKLQCKMEDTKENYKTFYINDMSCTFCEKQHTIDSFKHYLEECLYFRTNVTFRNKVHNIE